MKKPVKPDDEVKPKSVGKPKLKGKLKKKGGMVWTPSVFECGDAMRFHHSAVRFLFCECVCWHWSPFTPLTRHAGLVDVPALLAAIPTVKLASSGDMSLIGVGTPYGSFPVADDGYMAGPSVFDGSALGAPTTLCATPFVNVFEEDTLHYFEVRRPDLRCRPLCTCGSHVGTLSDLPGTGDVD